MLYKAIAGEVSQAEYKRSRIDRSAVIQLKAERQVVEADGVNVREVSRAGDMAKPLSQQSQTEISMKS